jgi:hypothetical protein
MNKQIYLITLLILSFSCNKPEIETEDHSAVNILSSTEGLADLKMAKSLGGNVLIANSYGIGDANTTLLQQFKLIKPSGEIIKSFSLVDTVYQFIDMMPGIDNGFFVTAANSNRHTIFWFKLDDSGNILWSGNKTLVANGYPVNPPAVTKSYDNNYMILYQNTGSGFYVQKVDPAGNSVLNKKLPPPTSQHQGSGLNYGETVLAVFQPNDSMIVVQGENYDEYSGIRITNCFLRALTSSITHKWFSNNFDTTKIETGAGMFYSNANKILFFGCKSDNSIFERYGTVFVRSYSLSGVFENEITLPQIEGSPTIIKKTISTPDGGYLLVGSNGQLPSNDLVSPNKIILIKLNSDLTLSWTQALNTFFPGRSFDVTYLNDGTLGLVGFLKENYSVNKVIYLHLDASGNIIS